MNKYLIYPVSLLLLLSSFNLLSAKDNTSYHNVTYIRNYDGDSITFDIPGTPAIVGKDMIIRLRDIDTPELKNSNCEQERKTALLAKNRVHSLLKGAKVINLHRTGRGKYFRILADIEFDERDLASILLEEGLAVAYSGGARNHDWCNEPNSKAQALRQIPAILPPVVDGVYVWPPPPKQE